MTCKNNRELLLPAPGFSRMAAEGLLWISLFLMPIAISPHSQNTIAIKAVVFTIAAGLILLLAVTASLRKRPDFATMIFPLAMLALTAAMLGSPMNSGVTRLLLVSSGTGLFLALRMIDLPAERVLLPLVAGGSAALLYSLFEGTEQVRLAGTLGNANLLGSYSAALLPAGTAFLLRKNRPMAVLFALLAALALYRSGTRSSVLALTASVCLVFLLRRKPASLVPATLLFVLAAVFTGAGQGIPGTGTLAVRRVIWSGAWSMFMEKPLTGWGTGSFQREFPAHRDPGFAASGVSPNTAHAHSEPLEILAENGLSGFLLFGAAFFILLRRASRNTSTLQDHGVLASSLVLLIEGLSSVALRWAPSIFLLAILAALLPEGKRSPGSSRFLTATAAATALALLVPGSMAAFRIVRSSSLLGHSVMETSRGNLSNALDLSRRAVEINPGEAGAWYNLGNLHGAMTQGSANPDAHFRSQLEAYDSLAVLAPDFAWMRLNRIEPMVRLGFYDRAMEDVLHVYRTREEMRQPLFYRGGLIAPAASPEWGLLLHNLQVTGVLLAETHGGHSGQGLGERAESAFNLMKDLYASAAWESPGTVPIMMRHTDSILASSPELALHVRQAIDLELGLAGEGRQLYMNTEHLPPDQVYSIAGEAFETGARAAWHRAAVVRASAGEGAGEYRSIAVEQVGEMTEVFRGILNIYPGSVENIILAARIFHAAGAENAAADFLLYSCLVDDAGFASYLATGHPPDFWLANGGPLASGMEPGPQTVAGGLLSMPGSEAPVFRLAHTLCFNSLMLFWNTADSNALERRATDDLILLMGEFEELYGPGSFQSCALEVSDLILLKGGHTWSIIARHLVDRAAAGYAFRR